MGNKRERQRAILELIRQHRIDSQQSLADELSLLGIQVSQATLSRDIQELPLVKAGNRYVVGRGGVPTTTEHVLRRVLGDYVVGVDSVAPVMVMKTQSGTAATVADALDGAGWPEIVGTIAGENTIFVLCRSTGHLEAVLQRVEDLRS